jgi:hypothetical protein
MHIVKRGLGYLCPGIVAVSGAIAPAWAQLAPPTGIVVAPAVGSVLVSWSAAPGAVSYDVLRTADARQAPVRVANVPGNSLGYRDIQPLAGMAYYQVASVGTNGARAPSALYQYVAVSAPTTANAMATGTASALAARASTPAPRGMPSAQPIGAANPLYSQSQSDSANAAQFAARLAAELENQLGASMSQDDLNALVAGIRQGGAAGIALAVTLTNEIAAASSSAGRSTPNQQPDTAAVNSMMATLPRQGPAASLASYLRYKLGQIKVKRSPR